MTINKKRRDQRLDQSNHDLEEDGDSSVHVRYMHVFFFIIITIFRPECLVQLFRELDLCAFMFDLNVLLTVILA